MRVLVTVPWAQRLGGAESMLQTILDGAKDSGHEFELIFFEPGPWADDLRKSGFHVEVLDAGRMREPAHWMKTIWRLAGVFHRRKPDLILNWSAKTQLYGSLASTIACRTRRVIWWQQMIPSGHWIDRAATLLPASAIGCCSESAAARQRRLWPRRRTFTVAPGAAVPHEPETATPIKLPEGVPIVGIVGRLQPWKGQDRVVRAHSVLRQRGHQMHTLIVGGDAYGLSTEYAASLPPLIADLGLQEAVTLTGQVPDAGPYIDKMDILVNASDPEPFGIVLLEAMARGVAVVAVNAGGPAEFIDDGETGILAATGSPDALADAIERLIASPGYRSAIAARGRERYLEQFTDVAMRARFFEALTRLTRESAT